MEARRIEKAQEKAAREAERQYVIEHEEELIKRGEEIISPDKRQEWRSYIEGVTKGYVQPEDGRVIKDSNVDARITLDVVQKLNNGESFSDVKDYLQQQEFASFNDRGDLWRFYPDDAVLPDGRTTMGYNSVRNQVARLADRGQDFWDYSAIGRIPTDEEIRAEFPWKEM